MPEAPTLVSSGTGMVWWVLRMERAERAAPVEEAHVAGTWRRRPEPAFGRGVARRAQRPRAPLVRGKMRHDQVTVGCAVACRGGRTQTLREVG